MNLRRAAVHALLALSFWPLLVAGGENAPIVTRVEIVGNRRLSPQTIDAIRGHISSRVGQPLDLNEVDQDVKAIYHTGGFERVWASVRPRGKENILVFTVEETPAELEPLSH